MSRCTDLARALHIVLEAATGRKPANTASVNEVFPLLEAERLAYKRQGEQHKRRVKAAALQELRKRSGIDIAEFRHTKSRTEEEDRIGFGAIGFGTAYLNNARIKPRSCMRWLCVADIDEAVKHLRAIGQPIGGTGPILSKKTLETLLCKYSAESIPDADLEGGGIAYWKAIRQAMVQAGFKMEPVCT